VRVFAVYCPCLSPVRSCAVVSPPQCLLVSQSPYVRFLPICDIYVKVEGCGTPRRFSILLAPARTCPHLSAPARTCPHLPARCRPCQPLISPARSFLDNYAFIFRLTTRVWNLSAPVRTCQHLSAPVRTCARVPGHTGPALPGRIAPSRCALCLVAHAVPPPSSQCAHGLLCQLRMSSRCNTDISATGTAHIRRLTMGLQRPERVRDLASALPSTRACHRGAA